MNSTDIRQQRVHHQTRRMRAYKLRMQGINASSCAVSRSYSVGARTRGAKATRCVANASIETAAQHEVINGVLHMARMLLFVCALSLALQRSLSIEMRCFIGNAHAPCVVSHRGKHCVGDRLHADAWKPRKKNGRNAGCGHCMPAAQVTCRRGARTCSGSTSAACRCRPCPAAR